MNRVIIFLIIVSIFGHVSCSNQKNMRVEDSNIYKGILLYYMHEPYFFPTTDTSFEKIAKANVIGLKLGKIDRNDLLDSISHKNNILIYASGDNNKIDTIRSVAGVLRVKIETRPSTTKLSADTSAIALVFDAKEWVLRYEVRFDKEVVSIKPILASDIKALNARINKIGN